MVQPVSPAESEAAAVTAAAPGAADTGPLGVMLRRLDALLVGGFAAAALVLASINVGFRLVAPELSIDWGDEVQVYLVVWAVCLSFAAVTAADRHVKADLFVGLMPSPLQRAAAVLADVLGLGMSVLLAWYGYAVAYDAWDFGDLSTTTLRFPLWLYYGALPVGAVLMALRYLLRVAAGLRPGAQR